MRHQLCFILESNLFDTICLIVGWHNSTMLRYFCRTFLFHTIIHCRKKKKKRKRKRVFLFCILQVTS